MIKVELKEEELDLVLQALAQQPYRSVAGLIQNILGQVQKKPEVTETPEVK